MPGFIAFINGLLALVVTGVGAYAGGSLCYGAFHWFQGDHQRGRSWIVSAVIGAGIALCAAGLGTAIGTLPHA